MVPNRNQGREKQSLQTRVSGIRGRVVFIGGSYNCVYIDIFTDLGRTRGVFSGRNSLTEVAGFPQSHSARGQQGSDWGCWSARSHDLNPKDHRPQTAAR